MANVVQIQCVQNGFIVTPTPQRQGYEVPIDSITVFGTHEALFEYLKSSFAIKVKAEPLSEE